jgi:hypothetical protein
MPIPNLDELALVFERELRIQLDPSGTGAANLRPGSANAVLVSLATQLGAQLFTYAAGRAAARDVLTAQDDDLDDLARDRYGDRRKEATASTGRAYLRRSGTAATLLPRGSRFAVRASGTQPAVTFEIKEDTSASAGVQSAGVPIACTEPGAKGNVDLAALTDLVDPLPDPTWQLYRPLPGDPFFPPEPIGGGTDRETNDQLRARLLQQAIDDLREKGTRRALLTGSARVPGVVHVTAIEPQDGTVILYAGDGSFLLPAALRLTLLTALEDIRVLGVPVLVRPYEVQVVEINARLHMQRALSHYDTGAIKDAAVTSIQRYFAARAQPDEYFVNAVEAAALRAHEEAQQVVLDSPLQDVRRPRDVSYGTILALRRYLVRPESIRVSVLDPLTS